MRATTLLLAGALSTTFSCGAKVVADGSEDFNGSAPTGGALGPDVCEQHCPENERAAPCTRCHCEGGCEFTLPCPCPVCDVLCPDQCGTETLPNNFGSLSSDWCN